MIGRRVGDAGQLVAITGMGAALGLLLALAGPAVAREKRRSSHHRSQPPPAAPSDRSAEAPAVDPLVRAEAREHFLSARAEATEQRARAQALAAYRLARRRGIDFLGDPARRVATARALDAALLVLRRSSSETAGWRRELEHAQAERLALQRSGDPHAGQLASASVAASGQSLYTPLTPLTLEVLATLGPGAGVVFAPLMGTAIAWPARGTLVSGPGIRRDPATNTDSLSESVEILSRMNEPVRAIARGRVRKAAALPQGGYAVVTEHDDNRISILSGLRQVDVAEGAEVEVGQPLGLVGRDLDGAPVLVFELWQDGAPIDPRPLLPAVR
jgi:murein DD-endopeptidase MepM/ murein hydrolase activator NlpD